MDLVEGTFSFLHESPRSSRPSGCPCAGFGPGLVQNVGSAFPVYVPLLAVPLHWWSYPSDSVIGHLWIPLPFRCSAFLGVVRLASVLARTSRTVSVRDRNVGFVTTGLAAASAAMFVLMYRSSTPVFSTRLLQRSWRTRHGGGGRSSGHGSCGSSRPSSCCLRRRPCGVAGRSAMSASRWSSACLYAHWFFRYELGDDIGQMTPSAGSVVVLVTASILCWLVAGYRVLAGLFRSRHAQAN